MQGGSFFRKFLFWIRYDGSRFSAMAKGAASHKGTSVYKLFECCMARLFDDSNILITTVSRTDSKVHALRNPFIIRTPSEYASSLIQTPNSRAKFINDFNDLIRIVGFENAMKLLEINPVAKGFNHNFHVSYRRYIYRIRRFFTMDSYLKSREVDKQSLVDLAEFNYSWSQPPTFCVKKAEEMCSILIRPNLNYASFYNHKLRDRLDGKDYKSTTDRRRPKLLRIYKGEPYMLHDEDSEYFNIEFIANGFLRQQIRRMISLISLTAHNIDHGKNTAEILFRYPDPLTFHQVGLRPAPPNGLFLADVVYDPRMFLTPIPFYPNLWDSMDDQIDENTKFEDEVEDDDEDLEDYTERDEKRQIKMASKI